MTATLATRNPLLDFYLAYQAKVEERGPDTDEAAGQLRLEACRKTAWGVPTAEAIHAINRHSPAGVVSMGAGLGYWEQLVALECCSVIAFDRLDYPNRWCAEEKYLRFPVKRGEPPTLRNASSRRTLLLAWPPHNSEMGVDSLEYYAGSTVIYVGEPRGGFCADDAFFDRLESGFECVERVAIPQWPTANDDLSVWVKR